MSNQTYTSMYSRNTELYHHGIKGQKWGVRNGPPYPLGSGKSPSAFISKYSTKGVKDTWDKLDDNSKVCSVLFATAGVASIGSAIKGTNSTKGVKAISNKQKEDLSEKTDAELQKEITRLQLENQYKQLKEKPQSKAEQYALMAVNKTINTVMDAAIKTVVNKYLPKALQTVSNKRKNIKSNKDIEDN